MSTEQTNRRIPNPRFRVLVIGRANAGKTTILQRVCDTTESPTIYRRGKSMGEGRRYVTVVQILYANLISLPTRSNLTRQWVLVIRTSSRLPIDMVPARRAYHRR
jgi:septin family protein